MITITNYSFYYIESNVFCIIVLALLLARTIRAVDKQLTQRMFCRVLTVEMFYFLTDIVWVLVDSNTVAKTAASLYFTNIVNYIGSALMGYALFVYMETYQDTGWVDTRSKAIRSAIPMLVNIAMILLTPLTHFYFSVDQRPELVNGMFYPVMLGISFGYLIVAAIHAFYLAKRPENYASRDIHMTIAAFPLIPILCGLIQAFNWRVPWICYGITFAMIIMYINFTEDKISMDPLTRLNNRNEMNRYLSASIKNAASKGFYVMMIDVDYFKTINDTYGHLEGDRALVAIAEALKTVCSERTGHEFIARFGGDEFVIITHYEQEANEQKLAKRVKEEVSKAGKELNAGYDLSVTTGYARYEAGTSRESIPGLFEAADQMLYENKRKRIKK